MMGQQSRRSKSDDHLVLGFAVRMQRTRCGLTQEELGADAGLHRNYVGAIERGEINPSFGLMLRLCRGLQVPLSELIGRYEIEAERRRAESSGEHGPSGQR